MSEFLKDEDVINYLRGAWFTMHTMTLKGKGDDHKFIIQYIRYIFNNTHCDRCDPHARELLKKYPPEEAYATGGYEGLFGWTVDRHNEVNFRLGKPQMTAQDAKLYYTKKTCKGCSLNNSKESEKKEKKDEIEDFLAKHTMGSILGTK